ncbi:MAG TPA: dockerin type I repeat-containing protein [Armatimonadota bacterium]|jgi:hypothetical protein
MKRDICISLMLLACGAAQASIVFQAEPPQTPTQLPAVQVAPWRLSRQTALRRAAEFGVVEGRMIKSPRGVVLQQGSLLFQQDALGTEFFADTSRFMAETPGEAKPMGDAEASRLAEGYLQKHLGRAAKSELALLRVAHLNNQGQDLRSGELSPATVDENIVYFKRMIAGVPIVPLEGPADQVRVHVDNLGNVTGQYQLLRNLTIAPTMLPILPYADAKDLFVRKLTQEMGDGSSTAFVTRIDFGYFGRPEGQPQSFLQPAYLFYVSTQESNEKDPTAARIVVIPGIDPKLLREPLELPGPALEGGSEGAIRFNATPPQPPSVIPMYPVSPTVVNTDTLLRRAAQLQMGDGSVRQTPRGLAFENKQFVLFMDEGGAEFYADKSRMLNEAPGEADPLPDEQVSKIAQEYVASLQDVDLGELGVPVVRHLMQQTFDTENQKPGSITQDESIVEFPRILHTPAGAPVPCIGPGAAFSVHIDNKGKPTGYSRVWRSVGDPLKSTDVRPYQLLQAEFLRQLGSELGQSEAIVTDIQYGLYFRPPGFKQSLLQPAILFDADIVDPATGEVTAHRQITLPAGFNPPEPLDNPDDQISPDDPAQLDDKGAAGIPALYGDLNEDGQVNGLDVALCLRIAGGLESPDDPSVVPAGDVSPAGTGDGALDVTDALRIVRSVYGLDDISAGA